MEKKPVSDYIYMMVTIELNSREELALFCTSLEKNITIEFTQKNTSIYESTEMTPQNGCLKYFGSKKIKKSIYKLLISSDAENVKLGRELLLINYKDDINKIVDKYYKF